MVVRSNPESPDYPNAVFGTIAVLFYCQYCVMIWWLIVNLYFWIEFMWPGKCELDDDCQLRSTNQG